MDVHDRRTSVVPACLRGRKNCVYRGGQSVHTGAASGEEFAKITHPADSAKVIKQSYYYHDSDVSVSDGIAYLVAQNRDLVAVDVGLGSIAWIFPAAIKSPAGSGVNIYNGKAYWCTAAGGISCVDIATQREIFRTQISDGVYAPMLIDDGRVYVAGRSCRIYCLDAENGDIVWSSASYDTSTWFSGGSVCIGDILYSCTSDEYTLPSYKKDTGEFVRIYPISANGYTMPVLYGDNIVLVATNVYSFKKSFVMEFDTANHTKLWETELDCAALSSPAIYEDVVYFGTDLGIVYGINLK